MCEYLEMSRGTIWEECTLNTPFGWWLKVVKRLGVVAENGEQGVDEVDESGNWENRYFQGSCYSLDYIRK